MYFENILIIFNTPLHRLYDGDDSEDGEGDESEAEGVAKGASDKCVEQAHFRFHPEPAGRHIVLPCNDSEDEAHDEAGQTAPQAQFKRGVIKSPRHTDDSQNGDEGGEDVY